MRNRVLIFIKPHAVRSEAVIFIENFLTAKGISLEKSGELSSEEIKDKKIIDRHYFSIARSAVEESPAELHLTPDANETFRRTFGQTVNEALDGEILVNSREAQERMGGISGIELNRRWAEGDQVKLGPGLYAGKPASSGLIVINGFYPAMKERFTAPGLSIRWYDASFDPNTLSWRDFRRKVIGATKPDQAQGGSLRSKLLGKYRELGLDEAPTVTNNGIHASAGPIEGMRERMVWLGVEPGSTPLGAALIAGGISRDELRSLLGNGTADFKGEQGPVFDITEDIDARDIPGALKLL